VERQKCPEHLYNPTAKERDSCVQRPGPQVAFESSQACGRCARPHKSRPRGTARRLACVSEMRNAPCSRRIERSRKGAHSACAGRSQNVVYCSFRSMCRTVAGDLIRAQQARAKNPLLTAWECAPRRTWSGEAGLKAIELWVIRGDGGAENHPPPLPVTASRDPRKAHTHNKKKFGKKKKKKFTHKPAPRHTHLLRVATAPCAWRPA